MRLTRAMTPLERFLAQIDGYPASDCCWLWTGPLSGADRRYAQFRVKGRNTMVHRWAYEHFRRPITEGLQIDHICATPRCVNPWHLRESTGAENVLAYWREQRTTCRAGHPLTDENTVLRLRGSPKEQRLCRTCERARQRRYQRKRRAARSTT